MYTRFYEFSEKPFNVTPDPRFLYQTGSHKESLASMIYGIKERKGFISIIGEVGTGKTTLIYTLLKQLEGKVNTVFLFHTTITFDQLLKHILLELEIPVAGEEKTGLLRLLHEYLIQKSSQDENLALVIDEAQNLSKEVLEELRMLSNLETPHLKLLQIVLVGQPELDVKLNSEDLRQLKQRIGIRCQIMPLSREECREYIDHRLKLVGSSGPKIFTKEAIALISDYAKGIPRTINILCDNALLTGYSLLRKKIDVTIIQEVIRDMEGSISEKPGALKPSPATVSRLWPRQLSFLSSNTPLFILSLFCLVLLFLFGRGYFQKSSVKLSTVKKELNAQVEVEVPKHVQREVMPRASEKAVSKEVPRESPKPVAKEIPKEVPKRVTKEGAEEAKKAGKMTAQESARTDKPGPAQGAVASVEAERIVSLPPPAFAEDEVRQFLSSYVDRYNRKDLDGLLSLFSSKAVQNQKDGLGGIRKIYANSFGQSQELQYRVDGMSIEIYRNWAEVKARFSLNQSLKKTREEKTSEGSIRWVLVQEDGNLKILSLDYEGEKSP